MPRKIKNTTGAATRRTLPARGAKTSAIAGLTKVVKTENAPLVEDEDVAEARSEDATEVAPRGPVSQYIPQVPAAAIPVFTTFKTKAKLDDGLCLIRSLGGGNFEIVNLTTVADGALGSEETGNLIKNDTALMKMVNIEKKEWDDARIKCNQAVMSARGTIFRFFKFPLELRNMIYEICFVSKKKLGPGTPKENSTINLAFLRASRTVYEEGVRFWRKNTFHVDYVISTLKNLTQGSNENVRILSIDINGQYHKDQELLDFVQACGHLKELTIRYTAGVQYRRRARVQRLHHDNADIAKFRSLTGFDVLCQLRGLDKVKVIVDPVHINLHGKITESERAKFEKFMNAECTRAPKTKAELLAETKAEAEEARKKAKALKAKKNRGRTHGGRKRYQMDMDDSDDEYDGTSRSWAH